VHQSADQQHSIAGIIPQKFKRAALLRQKIKPALRKLESAAQRFLQLTLIAQIVQSHSLNSDPTGPKPLQTVLPRQAQQEDRGQFLLPKRKEQSQNFAMRLHRGISAVDAGYSEGHKAGERGVPVAGVAL